MITATAWHGRRYGVLGLARSGAACVQALLAGGAGVMAWDADADRRAVLGERPGLTFADPLAEPLAGLDGLVVSPGVPLNTHPLGARAAAAGVPVIGDVELFAMARADLPPHRVVGITGTNGKSTTSALVAHLVRTAGLPCVLAGNIGDPILTQTPVAAGGVYVLELSSFQIDLATTLGCDVAVLTNVTPDHLDRYADFTAYADAKARLFTMPGTGAVLFDRAQPGVAALADRHGLTSGSVPQAHDLPPRGAALAGPHNAANAALAVAAARALGLPEDAIAHGLATFTGLPHRTEPVATIGGVAFVNDSKATNAASVVPALQAFDRIHWIVGGQAKAGGIADCLPHLSRVQAAYAIGEAAGDIAAALEGRVPVRRCGTLDAAVVAAAAAAGPGDTVLLAPACASFDQFADYADRGEAFRRAVAALPDAGPALERAEAGAA